MPHTTPLSESAVAVLRFRIKGYRIAVDERRRPAFLELAAAGIMEPVTGPDGAPEADFRFTREGMARREEILRSEEERIKRERFDPPDADISEAARGLLRRIVGGESVEVDEGNRPAYRELAAARILILGHSFAKGRESIHAFTYWGHERRFELAGMTEAIAPSPSGLVAC